MPNQSLTFNNDDSLSFEQPTYERFYHKNTDVLQNLLNISNQEMFIGLPQSTTFQERIDMRALMIDWLRQINSFRLSKPGVLALSVEIVDRYVYYVHIDAKNYQCVGASAYHLASKLEEVTPISASDMSKFTSDSCSASDIMDMEILISYKLDYNPKFVTPIDFIYLLMGFLDLSEDPNDLIKCASNCYLEVIDNFNVKKFPVHVIAVSCIIVVYHDFENFMDKEMNTVVSILVKLTNIEKKQISTCYDLINGIIDTKKSQCADLNSSVDNINGI